MHEQGRLGSVRRAYGALAVAAQAGVAGGGEADIGGEVAAEVGLIAVPELGCQPGPIHWGDRGKGGGHPVGLEYTIATVTCYVS
jgi:hypothetical protein